MAERTLPFPSHVVRWIPAPAFLGALFTKVAALLTRAAAGVRRHTRQPSLPRMSEEWLRTYNAHSGHHSEFWRDRW